jgi:hypothetical protein
MTLSCKDVWETGAGRIDYVWHVSGMPWATCNTTQLTTYLEIFRNEGGTLPLNVTDWFGAEGNSGRFVRFLTAYDERNTRWEWSFDEAAGLSGGDHQVQIAEIDPGIDWSVLNAVPDDSPGVYIYNATGIISAAQWGLPGVSQIYDVSNDDGIYYGEILTTAQKDATTIRIKDVRGLGAWLGTLTFASIDYALLWIGHEVVGVTSYVDNGDGVYTLTVERGLLRTRPQAHVAPEYATLGEYVSTAPLGGIVGRPSCLWAFPSDDNGATYGRPTLLLHGKVSQGIRIKDGVATIRVLGPLEWLKAPGATSDYTGNLTGYVLQRGNMGTEPGLTYGPAGFQGNFNSGYLRAPHLIMYEKYDGGEGYALENWANIWLCHKESEVVFWSVDELIVAIQDELDKLSIGVGSAWENQKSGDDTTDNPRQVLKYNYRVTKHGIYRNNLSIDNSWWVTGTIGGSIPESKVGTAESMIGGSIATVFGFALQFSMKPDFNNSPIGVAPDLYKSFVSVENSAISRGQISDTLASGVCAYTSWDKYRAFTCGQSSGSGPVGYMQYVPPIDMYERCWQQSALVVPFQPVAGEDIFASVEKVWFPRYYYEFSREGSVEYPDNGGKWYSWSWAVPYSGGGRLLYLEPNDGGVPVPGVALQLGSANYGTRLECVISGSGETGDVWYVDVSSSSLYGDLPGTYGASQPDQLLVFMASYYPCLAWIPIGRDDPWGVSQGSMAATNTSYNDLLRGALGYGSTPLAPSQALGWVPEVDGDGYEWIDFTGLEVDKITDDERYVYGTGSQSYYDTFMSFLRSHAMVPYLELTQEATYDLWKMRFRRLGNSSVSDAYAYGRRINDNVLLLGTSTERDVGSGHLYSAVSLTMNYEQGEAQLTLSVSDKSAYAQGGYARKTWAIDDRMTVCPSLSEAGNSEKVQAAITSRYVTGVLRHISRPRAATMADGVCRALVRLPVGAAALATDAYGRHPWTGARGYSDMPATTTKLSLELGSMRARIGWALSHASAKGWAPAAYAPAGSMYHAPTEEDPYRYTVIRGAYSEDVALNEFSGSGEASDLSRFDCLDYDEFTQTYSARGCSCGDYNITVHESDSETATKHTGSIVVATDGTTATLSMDSALSIDVNDFTSKDYIIQFGSYNDSETCQKALYVGFCDLNGYCGDGTSSDRWQ